jgi:hypothetical protein
MMCFLLSPRVLGSFLDVPKKTLVDRTYSSRGHYNM